MSGSTPTMVTRVENGVVMEAPFALVDGFTIAQSFPPSVAALMVEVPAGVTAEEGYLYASGTFTAPAVPSAPALTPAQEAAAAIAGGLGIISTSTAALSATYPVNATAQAEISAEVTAILLNGTFADGAATVVWLDVTGAQHTFTLAQFRTFASAVAGYVSGWTKFANGIVTTAPTQPVTIP